MKTGRPVAAVRVRFQVAAGPATLGRASKRRIDVTTDRDGRAAVSLQLVKHGAAIVAVTLRAAPEQVLFFYAHSDERTHALYIYAAPTYEAQRSVVRVRIVALDHHENPVTRAKLTFQGLWSTDTLVNGRIHEIGRGHYEAMFKTHLAGMWTLITQDRETKQAEQAITHVLPAPPASIRVVGEHDPRQAQPFGELLLRARLEDRFGNGHDPNSLLATAGNRPVPAILVGEEARFPVHFAGHGEISIKLRDRRSEISRTVSVLFAAAWLRAPALVRLRPQFRTELYWLPRPQGVTRSASVHIRFDPKCAVFVSFEAPEAARPALALTHSVADDLLTVTVVPKRAVASRNFPDGIHIGTATWECQCEGATCFVASAFMSPETPGWQLCPSQKESRRKCVCTNFIYPPGGPGADTTARRRADRALKQAHGIFKLNDNIGACCPLLYFQENFHAMTAAEWTTAAGAIGRDAAGNPNRPGRPRRNCSRYYRGGDRRSLHQHLLDRYGSGIERDYYNGSAGQFRGQSGGHR